jgi:hypothetical protein
MISVASFLTNLPSLEIPERTNKLYFASFCNVGSDLRENLVLIKFRLSSHPLVCAQRIEHNGESQSIPIMML